ncbi:DEAD/DEAH box helicase [Bacillus zhangzhouensis]|uniref:DEAD/DEAH box helicase n=1 Tax=Bacillus zhangzhouensis TaxID=1178540 RepID=UPI0020BDCF41|nr:DEAD/DEAH box helicase family protein [Bacillus zhangzhouensis]
MNIPLIDFQEEAVEDILTELSHAKKEIQAGGVSQAVVLSSPTGSGKTVMTTKVMEDVFQGTDEITNDKNAVFLWLSDSPELNEQSKKKVLATSDKIRVNDVVVINNDFDQEKFDEGKLYFINIQKLGKDKLLGSKGDKRTFTIWQTIENTQMKMPDKFYLIIDEAHRGMNRSKDDQNLSESIVQKFLLGDKARGLSPVKLVLGISATPSRFRNLLNQTAGTYRRLQRDINISPEKVRDSGLLKDKIVIYHPDENYSSDWSILAEAARQWKTNTEEWDKYTLNQGIPPVSPALIIQVEDRDDNNITKTDLEKVLNTIEDEIGELSDDELAHCFEEDISIPIGNRKIRKIDASKIQEEKHIKVIFFKMSLTTGWDCPRAEVMMSFRKAQDHTLIAQLIGRMVRTPLARQIEGQELLNLVSLYLPYYDSEGIKSVIDYLEKSDDITTPTIEVGNDLEILLPSRIYSRVKNILDQLPTYEFEGNRKTSNIRRLMKLSTLMSTIHGTSYGFSETTLKDSKELIIQTIHEEKNRLLKEDKAFAKRLDYSDEIMIKPVIVEQGVWKEADGEPINIELTPENIKELFNRSGRRLGNGLHEEYWSKYSSSDDYDRVKVELFLTLQQESTFNKLEKVCGKAVEALFKEYQAKINALKSSEKGKYDSIRGQAKEPQVVQFNTPPHILVRTDAEAEAYEKHLFINEDNQFLCKLQSTWEEDTIKEEIVREDVVCWLRNYDRKSWSLRIPYQDGKTKPLFPDFIIVRKSDSDYIVDILEPHRDDLQDNYKKAKGLALFAEKHWSSFGRIELIRKDLDGMKRLDFTNSSVREQVKSVTNNDHLNTIFEAYCTY